ncbi:40S ribosomal protein S13 [Tanacetum coccineum]
MSKLWGKDPFDDPFFTEPFNWGDGSRKEITIEELDNEGENPVPNTEVAVRKQPHHKAHESTSFSYRRVAYGGVNGVYYSSSIGQRTGGDGCGVQLCLLEMKEEDKTVGQALHTISRGIHEKILHNLNEDELDGFEENWKVNADKHIPGWNDGFSSLENAGLLHFRRNGHETGTGGHYPWTDMWGTDGAMVPAGEPPSGSPTTRDKKTCIDAAIVMYGKPWLKSSPKTPPDGARPTPHLAFSSSEPSPPAEMIPENAILRRQNRTMHRVMGFYLAKGISASAKPYKRTPPSWLKISSQDVEDNICKFAKKGLTPSQIGVILRDSHGIAQVNSVTGSKILRILKGHGLAPEIPEDLYHLIKKAVAIRKHLERNRKDKDSKFRLILVESRIHRLARYYKKTKKLPPVWK